MNAHRFIHDSYNLKGTLLKETLSITTEAADYLILGQDVSGLTTYPTEIAISGPFCDCQISDLKTIAYSFSFH